MASEMVGEILKLAISVTLVTVFSLGVYAYLPEERVPYLEIEMNWHNDTHVDITHSGGDSLQTSEITIQMIDSNTKKIDRNSSKPLSDFINNSNIWRFPQTLSIPTSAFNLTNIDNVNVIIIHPRAILVEEEVVR